MKRTTISLPDDLARRLEREAARRSVSEAEVVRSALAQLLGSADAARRPLPFPAFPNRTGETDVSERVEEILAEEWGGRAGDR